jgi:hypothetical protein
VARRSFFRRSIVALAALGVSGSPGEAQLRPIEPFDWRVFGPQVDVVASAGASYLDRQRISLAGESGTLWELGRFQTFVRLDRVALEAYGTAVRRFASDDVDPGNPERHRQDAGAMHVATTVLMTPRASLHALALRFGVGIPTTDNRIGLDRDETDFFATLMGRTSGGPLLLSGSVGVGIFGARAEAHEQNDVWVYDFTASRARGTIVPMVQLLGHVSTPGNLRIVGNEDLGELRAGTRIGVSRWIEILFVRGLADYSPRAGLRVTAGFIR